MGSKMVVLMDELDRLRARVAELEDQLKNAEWRRKEAVEANDRLLSANERFVAERDVLRKEVRELQGTLAKRSFDWRKAARRARIWDAVSHKLGICYEPDEQTPGEVAVHDIREIKAERDALREVVREALEDTIYAQENIKDSRCPEAAANLDDIERALRAALEVK